MYDTRGVSKEFLTAIGLHIGLIFNPYLFILVMDLLPSLLQDRPSLYMLFSVAIIWFSLFETSSNLNHINKY